MGPRPPPTAQNRAPMSGPATFTTTSAPPITLNNRPIEGFPLINQASNNNNLPYPTTGTMPQPTFVIDKPGRCLDLIECDYLVYLMAS